MPESLRTGADLVRASQEFAKEDRPLTWRLLVSTLAVVGIGQAVALAAPWWPVQLVGGLFAGLTLVRLFIFYHDHLHGAVLKDSRVGKAIMSVAGMLTLNPPAVWKETHDYHHRNNAKMPGTSIGSYPMMTVAMWRECTPSQRFWYRFARHPLTILTGYVTIFMLGMCLAAFKRDPKRHWQGPLAIAIHFSLVALVAYFVGWVAAVSAVMLPVATANTLGGYLFFAQHNFPDIVLADRRGWEFSQAAVKSSSMFEMSPLMHWFTGNIGYHHVHHLNHRIPFYRLPEAMAKMPELQNPGKTSWKPRDVIACLRLAVWDPEAHRMITWAEVLQRPPESVAGAATAR